MSTVQHYRTSAHRGAANWLADAIVAVLVMSWWKRLCYAAVLISIFSLAAHLFGALSIHLESSWHKRPISATDRAVVFVRAWIASDMAGMTQFVGAAKRGKLSGWIAANPVPAALAQLGPSGCVIRIVSAVKDDMDGAVIKVRVSDTAAQGKGARKAGGLALQLSWSYTGGQWMFLPGESQQPTVPNPAAESASYVPSSTRLTVAPSEDIPEANDSHPAGSEPAARNVVIPSTVPPWQRSR